MTLPLLPFYQQGFEDQLVFVEGSAPSGGPLRVLISYGGAWFSPSPNFPGGSGYEGSISDNFSGFSIDIANSNGLSEYGIGTFIGNSNLQLVSPDWRWVENWQSNPDRIEGPLSYYFDADDRINGMSNATQSDRVFSGPGDDSLYLNAGNDWGIGGDGDDLIYGGGNNDILYGDWTNAPVYFSPVTANSTNYLTEMAQGNPQMWDLAIPAEDSQARSMHFDENGNYVSGEPTGNDQLFGNEDSDTLYGGPGNDQLDGGPRGAGWTDVLYGGPGADMFYLSYETGGSASEEEQQSWWAMWGEDVLESTASDVTSTVIEKLAVTAAKDFFEAAVGGTILGGVAGAAAATVTDLIGLLFKHSTPQTPPITTEDVMVIMDFDPREDVLFLPMDKNTTLTVEADYYASAAVPGVSGWGASFKQLDKTYAELFLSQDYLKAMEITSTSDPVVKSLIENLFSTGLVVTDGTIAADTGGIRDPDSVYPFQDFDASDYVDGVVPEHANSTPLSLTAPSGSQSTMFGAFAPQVVYGPSVNSARALVSGTNMADILSVNPKGFRPEDYASAQLYEGASLVKGFGGDDIILGGNGQDYIYGGDGNDYLYSFFTDATSGTLPSEQMHGEDGNDILYTGGSAVDLDGGDGTDTVSYEISPYAVSVILASNAGQDIGHDANTYSYANIENIIGSAYDDQLIGDYGDNVISGGDGDDALSGVVGDDTIFGGAGYDSVRFTGGTTGVRVDLAYNNGTSLSGLWLDANGSSDTVDRASVEAYVGTAQDDWMQGDGDNGTNPLFSADFQGLGGNDRLVGSGLAETLDGGDGIDNLQGLGGADTLIGGDGDDTFEDAAGNWDDDIITDFETGDTVIVLSFDAGAAAFDTPGANGATVLLDGVVAIQLQGTEFDNKNLVAVQSGNDTYIYAPASVSATPITDGGDATGGDDIIDGSNEADLLIGLDGDDRLNGNGGDDTLSGRAGDDALRGEAGDDMLSGGVGDDTITGNDGNDTLTGGSGYDDLYGGRGDDLLKGGDGNDQLDGGDGNDLLQGGTGRDTLEGGDGDDVLRGGRERDTLDGGDGNDLLQGGTGRDTLEGGDGDDVLRGGRARDTLDGGDGNDVLEGGNGRDTLEGGDGDDVVRGYRHNDSVSGGNGDDTVFGGKGNDLLSGGLGIDVLNGGHGIDTFVFGPADGTDTVTDFELNVDQIGLDDGLTFEDLTFVGSEIRLDSEVLAILEGVDAAALDALDFVLV